MPAYKSARTPNPGPVGGVVSDVSFCVHRTSVAGKRVDARNNAHPLRLAGEAAVLRAWLGLFAAFELLEDATHRFWRQILLYAHRVSAKCISLGKHTVRT